MTPDLVGRALLTAAPRKTAPPAPRRWLRVVIVLVPLLLGLSTIALWYALSATPAYWQPVDRTRPEVREMAERFEQMMRAHLRTTPAPGTSAPAEPREWTADVIQDQLNSWLAVRVTEWGVNRGVHPRVLELMSRSMVNIDLEATEVALPFQWLGIAGVMRLSYTPAVGADKRMRLLIRDAHVGLVPVPVAMAIEAILARLGVAVEAEIERLRGQARALAIVVPLRDGRRASVTDLTPLPGKFVMTGRVGG